MIHPTFRSVARHVAWAALLLGSAAIAQGPVLQAPLAVLECQVPNMDTFVVHGVVPLPPGVTHDPVNCPYSLYDGNTRLLTQWSQVSARANGQASTVELLAVVLRGSMTVGSRRRFLVRNVPSADPALSFTAGSAFVGQMTVRGKDVYGNLYEGTFAPLRTHRNGAARRTEEYGAPLQVVNTIAGVPYSRLGTMMMWFSATAGTDVYEIACNYHNSSSQQPTWHLYFESLELLFPDTHLPLSMHPEPMAGNTYIEGSRVVLPLIRPIAGKMHFMEQRHERGFRYLLHPPTAVGAQHAAALQGCIGWARAMDLPTDASGTRTWSFVNPATPGYYPQAMIMPTLSHAPQAWTLLSNQASTLTSEISITQSVGEGIPSEAPIFLPDCFRNPYGVQYGGMTGAQNMHPYEGMETLWTGNEDGIRLAQMVMRCYIDRQPGAMYEDDGLSWRVDDPQYLNANGSQPYKLFNNVFLQQWGAPGGFADAPWEWDQTDKSHELQVESLGMVPPYRDLLVQWDPIDLQHYVRLLRMMCVLAYLDNDPLARRRLEAACQLARGSFYEGNGGALDGYFNNAPGTCAHIGREHAWSILGAAGAFSLGSSAWRTQWQPWFDKVHAVLWHVQSPGGAWQGYLTGKIATDPPFYGNFRVGQGREHVFLTLAVRAYKEVVFGSGVDPVRYARANVMLVKAGESMWNLQWCWDLTLDVPAGNGLFNRVAVGPAGVVTAAQMYTTHSDLPAVQSQEYCDSHQTGPGLAIWFQEAPAVTAAMTQAMQTFWGTTDVLGAALAQGISNIWNNAALIAYIQKHY